MIKHETLNEIYKQALDLRYWKTSPTKRSEAIKELSEVFEISEEAIERFLSRETYSSFWDKVATTGNLLPKNTPTPIESKSQKFIITSAQNNTCIHESGFKNLVAYSEWLDAHLLVTQYTYNRNGFKHIETQDDQCWYASELVPYTVTGMVELAPGLVLAADVNVLPTALYPLSGFEAIAGKASFIIGHAKLQHESYATLSGRPKFGYSTGTITLRNYMQKKAGQRAELTHNYGALIVEVDDAGRWFVRQLQIEPETGAFYDLGVRVENGKVIEDLFESPVECINWGDHHAEKRDNSVLKVCNNMLQELNPKFNVLHDILDFAARNHHNIKDPHWMFEQYANKSDSVLQGFADVGEVLCQFLPAVVVESNHDLAADRWLKEACFQDDPTNAIVFLTLTLEKYQAIEHQLHYNVMVGGLKMAGFEFDDHDVQFLNVDDSYQVCVGSAIQPDGIELACHGHIGSKGSKGSPKQFQKLGQAMNTGHTHASSIYSDVWTAGVTGSLKMGYNVGPSDWSHSHIVTYVNGARQIITFYDHKWKA